MNWSESTNGWSDFESLKSVVAYLCLDNFGVILVDPS